MIMAGGAPSARSPAARAGDQAQPALAPVILRLIDTIVTELQQP
jgi:hypothetical protein